MVQAKRQGTQFTRTHYVLGAGVLLILCAVFYPYPTDNFGLMISDKIEDLKSPAEAKLLEEVKPVEVEMEIEETPTENPKALHPDKYKFEPVPHPKTTSGKVDSPPTDAKSILQQLSVDKQWEEDIQEMRLAIALESFAIMMEDTQEKASTNYFLDISGFVELWSEALDKFGVRGSFEFLLETQQFSLALTQAAKALGIQHFYTETTRGGTVAQYMGANQPQLRYRGIPNDHNFYNAFEVCNGCLWWLRHYAGAVTASRLLAEGSVPLDVKEGTKVTSAWDFLEELRRLARRPYADPMDFHAQHGFGWHYLMVKHPDLTEYPVDILEEWCGDLVWRDEFIDDQNNDIGRECRHTFGHAIYQVLVQRELKAKTGSSKTDVRTQIRTASGFRISEESMCEGYKICLGSPNQSVYNECLGGMRHSHFLYTVGRNGPDEEEMKVIVEEYNRCEQKIGPPPKFES